MLTLNNHKFKIEWKKLEMNEKTLFLLKKNRETNFMSEIKRKLPKKKLNVEASHRHPNENKNIERREKNIFSLSKLSRRAGKVLFVT